MNISFYLKELLKSRNTVSIVGLGTLYKKKYPGKYDLEKNVFVPPHYTIGFNETVNEENEIGSFIANAENITIDSVNYQINQFVEEIHDSLKNGQNAELEGLGNFKTVDHNLTFDSAEETIFWNEYYGLPTLAELPFLDKKIDNNSTSEKSIPHIDLKEDSPELKTVTLENDHSKIEDYEDEVIESESSTRSSSKVLLKLFFALAVSALIIGTIYFLKPALFNGILNNNTFNAKNSEITIPLDTTTFNNDTLTKDSIPNLDSTVVLIPLTKPIDSNITTYEVIGSAEKSEKRIEQFINTMQKRGIEAKALENDPGKLVKISLGSFTDFNLAKKHKDSLRKKLNNPEIYIQTIKPKR